MWRVSGQIDKIFQTGGMTKKPFDECLMNKEVETKILQNIMDAQNEFNINTTPSFVINGNLIAGNKPKELRKIIDKLLKDYE